MREDFSKLGFKPVNLDIPNKDYRISISDKGLIIVSFDLEHASDFKEDAYRWCYVDFFIKKPGIDLPDELKRFFTRYIDTKSKKILWRHRIIVRIIDMDNAVRYITRVKNELEDLLSRHLGKNI